MEVTCPYCQSDAELIDSGRIYKRSYGMVWICQPCQAWVGVHKDHKDHKPLGTLANAALRILRMDTHAAFDPFWIEAVDQGQHRGRARRQMYLKLREAMGIPRRECHIASFDETLCRSAIEICAGWRRAAAEAAARSPDVLE